MQWNLLFLLNSVLFGIGLAMDAFSVSMANGLHEPEMKTGRMCLIAGTFGLFQILMPLLGWVCIHTIAETFVSFQRLIPWIALILLGYIGGRMLLEGLRNDNDSTGETAAVSRGGLLIKGIATFGGFYDRRVQLSGGTHRSADYRDCDLRDLHGGSAHWEIFWYEAGREGIDPRRRDPYRNRTGDFPDRGFLNR